MGRGASFSPIEVEILKNNYDKTIVELEELLLKQGYRRSRKSINRKLEKLRETGEIGLRSKETVRRSYRQRDRRVQGTPTILDGSSFADSEESFHNSEGFGDGFGKVDWGDEEH